MYFRRALFFLILFSLVFSAYSGATHFISDFRNNFLQSEFASIYAISDLLSEKVSPYGVLFRGIALTDFRWGQSIAQCMYSPSALVFFTWPALLNAKLAWIVWTGVSVGLLATSLGLIFYNFRENVSPSQKATLTLFWLATPQLWLELKHGSTSALICSGSILGWALIRQGYIETGPAVWSCVIALSPSNWPLTLTLLRKKHWMNALSILSLTCSFSILPVLLVDSELHQGFLQYGLDAYQDWFSHLTQNYSLSALVATILVQKQSVFSPGFLSGATLAWLSQIALSCMLWFPLIGTLRAKSLRSNSPEAEQKYIDLSYCLATTLIVFFQPAFLSGSVVLLLPVLTILYCERPAQRTLIAIVWCLTVFWIHAGS